MSERSVYMNELRHSMLEALGRNEDPEDVRIRHPRGWRPMRDTSAIGGPGT